MQVALDLFRKEKNGNVWWIRDAASMEEAEQKIAEDANKNHCEHLIVNLHTGASQKVRSSR
jgi:hypothetical protein